MTRTEAVEAGKLAKALADLETMRDAVKKRLADEPDTWLEIDVFVGGNGVANDEVAIPPWMVAILVENLDGVIVQRLAALGVYEDPAPADE